VESEKEERENAVDSCPYILSAFLSLLDTKYRDIIIDQTGHYAEQDYPYRSAGRLNRYCIRMVGQEQEQDVGLWKAGAQCIKLPSCEVNN
jgi:hypothetical protein